MSCLMSQEAPQVKSVDGDNCVNQSDDCSGEGEPGRPRCKRNTPLATRHLKGLLQTAASV